MEKQYEIKEVSVLQGLGSLSNFILLLVSTIFFTSTYYILLPVLPLHLGNLGSNYLQIGLIMGIFFHLFFGITADQR